MANLKLHLDADTSIKALYTALLKRGHDVTRTPNQWISSDASDAEQFLGQLLRIVAFLPSISETLLLWQRNTPSNKGMILAAQSSWSLSDLVTTLDHVLIESSAEDWVDQVRWLNNWYPLNWPIASGKYQPLLA